MVKGVKRYPVHGRPDLEIEILEYTNRDDTPFGWRVIGSIGPGFRVLTSAIMEKTEEDALKAAHYFYPVPEPDNEAGE